MDDANDKSPDRLEQLLRQWGAEQAVLAEQAKLGNPPTRSPAARPGVLARLGPVLAAAGLMFAAAGAILLLASRANRAAPPAERPVERIVYVPTTSPEQAQLDNLLHREHTLLVEMGEQKRWYEARLREQQAKQQQAMTELAADSAERIDELNAAKAALVQAESKLTTSAGELAAARAEVDRLTKTISDAEKAATDNLAKSQSELARQRQLAVEQFQAVYLGGQDSLAARQQAARRNRLIERYAALRDNIKDEQIARLGETIEVWLTRLDQLDVRNASASADFARQLAQAKLAGRIEPLLNTEPRADVRGWLLECELIFHGLSAAG